MNLQRLYDRSPPAVQTLLLNAKAAELHLERYGPRYERLSNRWLPNERLPPERMRALQNETILRLADHAQRTVPFYRERWGELGVRPGDIRSVHDLTLLPTIGREDIAQDPTRFVSEKTNQRSLRRGSTSGTTGTPLELRYDVHTCVAHHVADWRQKAWGGMRRGERYASLQGRTIVPQRQAKPPFWRMNHLGNQLFLSAFHLHPAYLDSYIDKLRDYGVDYIEGYPSTVSALADWLNRSHAVLPMKAVFTSSETLYDFQRASIQRAFACSVFDSLGMAERVLFASECETHEGRHLNEDYGVTEVLDDADRPVPDGEAGRLVATTLTNFAFPLIRYRTNDISSRLGEPCACGRSFPRIASVTTKQEAMITLADGRLISPSVLTHPFKPMKNVAASQIIQSAVDSITVRIVRREGYGDADERTLIAGLAERLGSRVALDIEYVDSVAPEPGRKFRWVISRVPPSIGVVRAHD